METTEFMISEKQLIEALNHRYATKRFDPNRKLAPEQVKALLEALRLSASSMGLQPYRFIHVKDSDVRQELRVHSYDQPQITDASELVVFAAKTEYSDEDIRDIVTREGKLRGYDDEQIKKRIASVTKYVRGKEGDRLFHWNARQLYIAIGNVLTSAAVLGIDACPMEGIKGKEYDRILGLETLNLKSLAVVTLGYRSSEDTYAKKAKVRLPAEKIIKTI
jgi:nitroreductase